MVKRCAWGECKSDSRYPDRLTGGVSFIPFPKLGRTREKARRWIRLCGRPHEQLNESILAERRRAKHLFVCTKHFVDGMPSVRNPDPIPALSHDKATPARPPPKNRRVTTEKPLTQQKASTVVRILLPQTTEEPSKENIPPSTNTTTSLESGDRQGIINNLDLLALAAENRKLKEDLDRVTANHHSLQLEYQEKQFDQKTKDRVDEEFAKACLEKEDLMRTIKDLQKTENVIPKVQYFRFETTKPKDFQYYTGFSYERYLELGKFLIPNDKPFEYSKALSCLLDLSLQDQLLLVLMKLRQDFDFKHLATLFGISPQDCSSIFNDWINYMFFRLGSVPVWPHRDIIIEQMTDGFKKDFPNTVSIIDGTEVKIERPSSLRTQSQCYSDYKSSTTLKSLIGVDPRGSVTFVSMLFSGSISDKELTERSGYYEVLKQLMQSGMLKEGDGIMADKGFTIEKELKDLGLRLNIPPFASSCGQMSASEVTETIKIAKHRVHVERAIARIKQFKILSNKLSLSLFKSVNQIWLVCSMLTNSMPFLLAKE